MTINCIPTREIFFDPVGGYRILACSPVDSNKIELNNYGNFTISGNNLVSYKLNQPILLEIEPKENAKRKGEYVCLGYGGIKINHDDSNITIDPLQEKPILLQFMTMGQANNVLEAYPNFVEMVLNDRAEELDVNRIYNVGKVRLAEYIDKIKNNCDMIFFNRDCWAIGINKEADIEKIKKIFGKIDLFIQSFKSAPYHTLCDDLEFSFDKADDIVLHNFDFLENSSERCKYFCIDMLRVNEQSGDTRINPNIIAKYLKENIPILYPYVVDLIKNDEAFYYDNRLKFCSLRQTYLQEKNIAEHIKHRLKLNESIGECDKVFVEKFRTIGNMDLTDEQIRILEIMDKGWIAVLTGSAGVGKSSATKALIRMLEAKHKSYTLLAPTGVSSKVLKNMTGRYACTVHMLLAKRSEVGEYVIVDEASMLTVSLLSKLFDYIGKDRKIVFVCDENQLPSIGAGNIVHDLIHSGKVPVATLTKIFRYNSSGIITNVTDVRQGKFNHAEGQYDDFVYIEANANIENQLLNQYQNYLDQGYDMEDILILSPFRVGQFGSHAINNAIQSVYNKHPDTDAKIKVDGIDICFKVGDRVINTKNNYEAVCWDLENNYYEYKTDAESDIIFETTAIYNGDLGKIVDIRKSQNNTIQIIVEWDDAVTCVEGVEINNLLLGYCISGHKSQGAQSKVIIDVINRRGRDGFLNRNLLYTMLSRAQEKLTVIANKQLFEEGLEYQANLTRETWLEEMLNE